MTEPVPLSRDTTRLLRHLVATIAYRSRLSIQNAPEGYDEIRAAEGAMSAVELVNHMTNVMGYFRAQVTQGERERFKLGDWDVEVKRFYELLNEIDSALAAGAKLPEGEDLKMLQGPLADTCTHVGQLAALRRLAGSPVPGENFIKAEITVGGYGID